MNRIAYVNGDFLDASEARISVFDRGFLFADGVYEVTAVLNGRLVDNEAHLDRLGRSLRALEIPPPAGLEEIVAIQERLVHENDVDEGTVYLQITRGHAERDFAYPKDPRPSLVLFTYSRALKETTAARVGIKVITVPDIRWRRRDIKTIGLLAASMAKQAAVSQGVDDAWMVENGFVTEGSSSNAFIVNREGRVMTHPLGSSILAGITRAAVLRICRDRDIPVIEKPFTVGEALQAREAFITSASAFVCPIVSIDGHLIGDGRPGPVAATLRRLYIDQALHSPAAQGA